MLNEGFADLPPLVLPGDGKRTEGQDLLPVSFFVLQPCLRVHDIADDPAVQLRHESEGGNEIGMAAHGMDKIMLVRAGLIDVPEGLAGHFLHGTVVLFRFRPDDRSCHRVAHSVGSFLLFRLWVHCTTESPGEKRGPH